MLGEEWDTVTKCHGDTLFTSQVMGCQLSIIYTQKNMLTVIIPSSIGVGTNSPKILKHKQTTAPNSE